MSTRATPAVAAVLLLSLSFFIPLTTQAQPVLERVEITGSALRRSEVETTVPVTIIRADDLIRHGITQMEQAISWVAANQSSLGIGNAVGAVNGGKAEADLRGLSGPFGTSANKTLVLLNGRRLVNHPFDGAAVDLYALPLAAVDRIEILRDGASALYGSDAIGGVVNVILKREQQQTRISVDAQGAQHRGGASRRVSLATGLGSLDEQGVRAVTFLDWRKQNRLAAVDRPFARTGILRDDPFWLTSGTSFPGDIDGFEPSTPACSSPDSFLAPDGTCRYDTVRRIDAIPANEQRTAFFRGDLKLSGDLSLGAEYLWSRSHESSSVAPAGAQHCMRAPTAQQPSPFFPDGASASALPDFCGAGPDELGGIVDWREVPVGNRKRSNTTLSDRAMLELQGSLNRQWEFRSALGRSQSRSTEKVLAGFADDELIQAGIWNGVINPFGDQTVAGQAAISAAQVVGPVQSGRSRSEFADLRLVGELMSLDAGPLSLAVGAEHRRDQSAFDAYDVSRVLPSLGLDADSDTSGSRHVSAIYGELGWPVTRALELTLASRLDRYSDFGSTFNPKVGARLRASPDLLFRGSIGRGFRAPSLYEVHRPQAVGFTYGLYDDPQYCPGGQAQPDINAQNFCSRDFGVLTAGSAAGGGNGGRLQPEKSTNVTLGFVMDLDASSSIGIDFWHIAVRNLIGSLPEQAVFDDSSKYASRIVRCSQVASMGGTGLSQDQFSNCNQGDATVDPIAYIDLPIENLGRLTTRGLDFSAAWHSLANPWGRVSVGFEGTYVHAYRYQRESGGAYVEAVGRYADNAPIFRWQHALSVNWQLDAWSVTVAQRFKSGYVDQEPSNRVPSYTLHDLTVQWRAMPGLTFAAGVRNLFDRDPPLTLQYSTFQAGYDPRFTDPLGRVFALHAAYRY